SKVPLSPDIEPKDLILSAEYAEFLDATHLDELRPDADLTVTCPGQYHKILEHIEVHRYYMGVEQQREIPYSEAVEHWYDRVYLPVVITMRELGVLNEFPKRSEADLYLWIADHRAAIEHELGWEIATSAAAADLADQHSPKWTRVASRLGRKVLNIMMPQPLESAAAAGSWRRERLKDALSERLFIDVLVALDGGESGWNALEQAVEVARREEGRLRAVHVVASEEALEEETVQAMRDRFYWRCGEVGLPGRFAVEVGSVSRSLAERARWTDLIVAGLNYPPGDKVVSKLSSGLRQLIRRSTRPVLSVPELKVGLQKALLAYDDSPRAREALFVASYAAGRWQMPLVVVHVAATMGEAQLVLQGAREYVASHGLEATYVPATGDVAEALVATAEAEGCDWIIAGGYEPNPVIDVVKGTALDGVLNLAKMPVLVCQ
ncbi:MAG: universal stress protein, partial [Candidatus Promineifilaceae bacterium]|nr:universal stress protein [Candidatus Promineifilaceae bacterium]